MNRIDAARAKIRRSLLHFDALSEAINAYDREHAPSVYTEKADGVTLYRAKVSAVPMTQISLILGDWVHNLRSALDFATCALVASHERDFDINKVQFPFGRADSPLNNRDRSRLPKNDDVITAIEQARSRGGGSLFYLDKMSNQDKHRLLVPCVVRQQKVELTMDFANHTAGLTVSPAIDTHSWRTPIEDGTVLVHSLDGGMGEHVGIAFTYAIEVEGEPPLAVDHLRLVGSATEAALAEIERACSSL